MIELKKIFSAVIPYLAFLLCMSMTPVAAVSSAAAGKAAETYEAATYLMDCYPGEIPLTANNSEYMLSGWDIDRRGGDIKIQYNSKVGLLDESEEYAVSIEREIDAQSSGVLTLETGLIFSDMADGFSFCFSGDGARVIEFVTKGGYLCYVTEKGSVPFFRPEEEVELDLKAVIDLDGRKAELSVNGEYITEIELDGGYTVMNRVRLETPKEEVMNFYYRFIRLYKNYLVNERFMCVQEGTMPYDWQVDSKEENTAMAAKDNTSVDWKGLKIKDDSIVDKTVVTKSFDPCGKICFTMQYLIPERRNKIGFALCAGSKEILRMETNGENMCYNNGAAEHFYSENMWQLSRIEVDLEKKEAVIKHNGKEKARIALDTKAQSLDSFTISTTINGKSEFYVDDVYIMPITEEPADYPSEPVIPADDDYAVGMMQCSLWREGVNYGWDEISAHYERTPYLGFYDEGKIEVTDWELKWMAEHGVDFEAMCWYMPESYTSGPMKNHYSSATEALHEAYFNAKYSQYVDFALLVCSAPPSAKAWREHIVPYWIEYYFKDDRYMTIDNKPVIYIFNTADFKSNFGGEEQTRQEFDYLEDELKKLGFDGAIFLGQAASADQHQSLKNSGYDAVFRYNWGMDSYKPEFQINEMLKQYEADILPVTPTVSQGYNQAAWRKGTDVPYCAPEDFETVLTWVRDDLMKRYDESSVASKLVSLANWNEYGEGHIIMPSELHGFEYLDKVRNVFTEGGEHSDSRPTENQLKRLRGLFPENRRRVRYIPDLEEAYPSKVLKGWYFDNSETINEWTITKQVEGLTVQNGRLCGKTTGADGGVVLKASQNIPIRDVSYIKIVMKDSVHTGRTEIFFTTDSDAEWTQAKSAKTEVASGDGMNEYYFRLDTNKLWKGNLDKLRFDMTNVKNTEFEIESIEILENDSKSITLNIDNEQIALDFSPENSEGTVFVPITTVGGWQEKFNAVARWENVSQTLTLYTDEVNMVFTMGSRTVLVNGETVELPAPAYMKYNLPMLPIRFVAETLGGELSWDGAESGINITVPKKETVKETKPVVRVPFEWEFDVDGDGEGFNFGNSFSRVRIKDGILTLKSTSDDPMFFMNNISLDTSVYRYIRVRMKNTTESKTLQIFFTSDVTGAQSQANSVRQTITTQDSEYKEYVVDMLSNENWQGTITSLRIDPISAKGTVEIDYIRVTE